MLKAQEIHDKSVQEIESLLVAARKELYAIVNAAQFTKKLEKPHLKREKRKEIARLLTVLRSKQAPDEARS